MKKTTALFLTALCALFALSVCQAQIVEKGNAQFLFGGQKFGFLHWGKDWSSFDSHYLYPHLIEYRGLPDQDVNGARRRVGTFKTYTGTFEYTENFRRISENEADFELEFTSQDGVPTQTIAYSTELSLDFYRNNPATVDDKAVPFGKGFYKGFSFPTKLVLNLPTGQLILTGDFGVGIQFNQKEVSIRLNLPAGGIVKQAKLRMHALFIPAQDTVIDLRSAMNRDLIDEVADDQIGGWTDQGPLNDMRALPTGRLEVSGIPFEIVDPAQNERKACIAIAGAMRPYFAQSVSVDVPSAHGRYLYLLNGLAWGKQKKGEICGQLNISYDDGSMTTIELKSGVNTADFWGAYALDEALVGWQNRNESSPIGLYASWFPLASGKCVTNIEFVSRGQVWMILAATISSKFPDEQSLARKVKITANDEWLPLDFKRTIVPGSVLDFSKLADAPAGKYGFARVNAEGKFEFEKLPGVTQRFWGTNLCFGLNYMTHEESIQMLDDIVALGYNAIRPHHFDCGNNGIEPNALVWERFDFMLAEAKKRGLYITSDLFTARFVTLPTWGHVTEQEFKWLCYFNDEAYKNLMDFAKLFLCHKNQYTGIALKDDPAFICLSLINESSLMIRVHQLTDRTRPVFEENFAKWCEEGGHAGEREALMGQFFAEVAKKFYARISKDLREMGVRIPLTDQNMVYHIPTQIARLDYDYVDSHFYWGHPVGLTNDRNGAWRVNAQSITSDWGGEFRDSSAIRIFGKPNTITEWNYCYPNPTCAEEQIIMPASAALQGFDGLYHFCYAHAKNMDITRINVFDLVNNPMKRLGVGMGNLLFRRDVAESQTILPYDHTQKLSGLAQLSVIAKTGMRDPSNPNFQQETIPAGLQSEALVLKLIEQGRIPAECMSSAKSRLRHRLRTARRFTKNTRKPALSSRPASSCATASSMRRRRKFLTPAFSANSMRSMQTKISHQAGAAQACATGAASPSSAGHICWKSAATTSISSTGSADLCPAKSRHLPIACSSCRKINISKINTVITHSSAQAMPMSATRLLPAKKMSMIAIS